MEKSSTLPLRHCRAVSPPAADRVESKDDQVRLMWLQDQVVFSLHFWGYEHPAIAILFTSPVTRLSAESDVRTKVKAGLIASTTA